MRIVLLICAFFASFVAGNAVAMAGAPDDVGAVSAATDDQWQELSDIETMEWDDG